MKLYNHIAFKMGQREAQIATYIKGGGNWQDIPLTYSDTRLDNIRATGGRTTYYGRLAWDKPSYTIATYFNRVGNGCNLHPEQNRVMSNREAARFQSFPDDFIFQGSKTSQYKQIGNAVPPLLARLVSSLIKPHLDSYNFVDLFAGCGGMSEGFIMNGFNLLAVNEVDKNIMLTNKFNHSKHTDESHFILGDVTQEEIKQKIINACEGNSVDVVIGGPPCQGFSNLGKRDADDEKNRLVYEYIRIIYELEPTFILMENVPGMSNGIGKMIFKKVVKFLQELYYIEYGTLNAADYGVPQTRKRLVLHGIRKDIYKIIVSKNNNFPITLLPQPTHSQIKKIGCKKWITVGDSISDLPAIGAGEICENSEIKNHIARRLSQTNIERLQEIRDNGGNKARISEYLQLECHKKKNVSYTDTYGIIDSSKPAPTITSGCTIISKGRYCHPTQNRGLSVREAARLQSFDDNFEFVGNIGEMSLQIGNAVPPKLAQASGNIIKFYMKEYERELSS